MIKGSKIQLSLAELISWIKKYNRASNSSIEMRCADENFAVRKFTRINEGNAIDYVCEHCGFMQRSAASGAAELCRNAHWNSQDEYEKYAAIARAGGEMELNESRKN